jgi:PadR family transcriptional regulator PadR
MREIMETLSQREEQILLAILSLNDDAYLVAIKKYLAEILGKNWTVGAVHKPLRRLEQIGVLESYTGEATARRGGRAKKIYKVTKKGYSLLTEYKRINEALWSNFPGYHFSG